MAQIQMQTHQGYIQADGRLDLIDKLVQLPKNIKVTVSWEEEVKPHTQEGLTPEQLAIKNAIADLHRIREGGLSEETLKAFESLERGDFKPVFEERLP